MAAPAAGADHLFGVVEFIAAEYGWKPRDLEEELTDEQLLGLLEQAEHRVADRFDAMVESVRIGTVIASDKKALNHWRTRHHRAAQRSRGLSGEALEAAIGNLATMFPKNVVRGVMVA